jgi:predicted metal-binding membrane protein
VDARRRRVTALERALRRDRILVLGGLAAILAPAWIYLVRVSLDMYGPMRGPSAWMMRATWDAPFVGLVFVMWSVMMAGMMLPSAAPAILIFARAARSGEAAYRPVLRAYLFAAGYLSVWLGFSLAATALQALFASRALVTPMMESATPYFAAALLALAGTYQWSASKRACLRHCRGPVAFLSEHWRPGLRGALGMGAQHGLYCLGCCWALMLLLFAGGVMSLTWIAGLSLFVLFERTSPFGETGDRVAGTAILGAAAGLLVHALAAG